MTSVLLFIPALLDGDIHGFMTKLAVMMFAWLTVVISSGADLVSGIAASKRAGVKRTTSWGMRRTLTKLLQYFAVFFAFLLLDVVLSALGQFLPIFSIPILSICVIIGELVSEVVSVLENTRKGKNKEEDKMDDLMQLAAATVDAVGADKLKEYLQAVNKYVENKKS
jgi:hypothetical protein